MELLQPMMREQAGNGLYPAVGDDDVNKTGTKLSLSNAVNNIQTSQQNKEARQSTQDYETMVE
jgi:hypothetical protein